MHVISIDIGSYSVKIVESRIEKKTITHFGMREFVLAQLAEQYPDLSIEELQHKVISKYLGEVSEEVKIIMQAPNLILTNRFLELPIKNRKKAEQMIPFQLEEVIPFSLRDIHRAQTIVSFEDKSLSLVSYAQNSEFENFHSKLAANNIVPNNLTSETSLIDNYFSHQTYAGAYLVLDLGHQATKGYIFINNKIISSHMCFVAGKTINEVISSTYKIQNDEAIIYKHQNCFLLTEKQYESVDENQKIFAQLMDQTFTPLIHEIRRWELGFRVQHGLALSNIYICGGTSNIKNITNYLTQKTGIKTQILDTLEQVKFRGVDTDAKFKSRFFLANLMAHSYRKYNNVLNLLNGQYAQTNQDDLPLYSMSFIAVRMAAVSACLILFLIAEGLLLNRDNKLLSTKVSEVLKNDTYQISNRDRRLADKNPEMILKKLKKKSNEIEDEIKSIQSAVSINSLAPLSMISKIAQGSPAWLQLISVSEDGFVEAIFEAEDKKFLDDLQRKLLAENLQNVFMDLDEPRKLLKLEFRNK